MGQQCRSLRLVLHLGTLEGGKDPLDHEATWMLGHTQRMSFGALRVEGDDLFVDATLHLPCKWLEEGEDGQAACRAHGFRGPAPASPPREAQPRRLGRDRFRVVENQRLKALTLPFPRRSLPVLGSGVNKCIGAPCRTADNTRGAACCRDLQLDILARKGDAALEALVRSRRSPWLCKVKRSDDDERFLEAEVLSACDYLDPADGVSCTLHGRVRPDGRPAKPELCSEWPPKRTVIHNGCAYATRWQRAQHA